jgi:3-methyladenine DNA glycosylase Mpg
VEPVNFAKDHPQGLRAGAGPGKAARLLGIDGSVHGMDLCQPGVQSGFWTKPERWGSVVRTPRIGISRGQDLLWRFCLKNHPSVSGPRFPLVRNHKSG